MFLWILGLSWIHFTRQTVSAPLQPVLPREDCHAHTFLRATPARNPPVNARGGSGLLLLGAIWGGSYSLMRLGAAEFGPLALGGLRALCAALVLCPLAWYWQRPASAGSHVPQPAPPGTLLSRAGPIAVLGVTHSALPFVLFNWAALHLDAGMSGVLGAAAPLFAALFATLWHVEPVQRRQWAGMGLGLCGVIGLAWAQAGGAHGAGHAAHAAADAAGGAAASGWAAAACLLAAALYGWSANYAKRRLQHAPPIVVAAGGQAAAALVLLGPMLAHWPAQMPSRAAWTAALLLALVCTAYAFVLFYSLVARLGATRAQVISLLVPSLPSAGGGWCWASSPRWPWRRPASPCWWACP